MSLRWAKQVSAWSLEVTIFSNFWEFFPAVFRNKLPMSTNFILLGATDQKLRRNLGSQITSYSLTVLG
jgi:hypothetical protein